MNLIIYGLLSNNFYKKNPCKGYYLFIDKAPHVVATYY
jgi:hypothetical protein